MSARDEAMANDDRFMDCGYVRLTGVPGESPIERLRKELAE